MLTSALAGRPKWGSRLRFGLGRLVLGLFDGLLVWQTRLAQREQLAALDDRLLSDIGLTRSDVERERAKPFWMA